MNDNRNMDERHQRKRPRRYASPTPASVPQPPAAAAAGLYEALERESKRLCDELESGSALNERVVFDPYPGLTTPTRCNKPVLTLLYDVVDSPDATQSVLATIASVLAHSARLNRFPSLKTAFWRSIIETSAALVRDPFDYDPLPTESWLWLVLDARFPVFRFEMSHKKPLTAAHMNVLATFFTTPPAHAMHEAFVDSSEAPRELGVELVFSHRSLRHSCLQHIERFLDRIYASPMLQFTVARLDFGSQKMNHKQLEGVASIVSKCHRVYCIEAVALSSVLLHEASRNACMGMQQVIAAACSSSQESRPSSLKALALRLNRLQLEHIATICSALRYGRALESIDVYQAMRNLEPDDRVHCWRWLAFALFYPRAKTLVGTCERQVVRVFSSALCPEDCEAFVRTLDDPVSELVHRGRTPSLETVAAEPELLVCTVADGTTVYRSPRVRSNVLQELEGEQVLEALCQQDEWTCVVVSGLGLGWVPNTQVRSVERSSPSEAIGIECLWEWMEIDASSAMLQRFVERIGHQLGSLDVGEVEHVPQALPMMLRHCSNLKHLGLRRTALNDEAMDTLVEALSGTLGDHLVSLNLSDNSLSATAIAQLARLLADPTRAPALRELELSLYITEEEELCCASLVEALQANKRLRFLIVDLVEGETPAPSRKRIEREHHCELLPSPLPLRQKLAFLSVLEQREAVGAAASGTTAGGKHSLEPRQHLDRVLVANVFAFAADDVRRQVLWLH